MGLRAFWDPISSLKNLPMHTYWELLPLEKLPTKHVHILANQTFFNTYAPT